MYKIQKMTVLIADQLAKNRNSLSLLVECKMVQTLWKTVWNVLKKLNLVLTYDPVITLCYE